MFRNMFFHSGGRGFPGFEYDDWTDSDFGYVHRHREHYYEATPVVDETAATDAELDEATVPHVPVTLHVATICLLSALQAIAVMKQVTVFAGSFRVYSVTGERFICLLRI